MTGCAYLYFRNSRHWRRPDRTDVRCPFLRGFLNISAGPVLPGDGRERCTSRDGAGEVWTLATTRLDFRSFRYFRKRSCARLRSGEYRPTSAWIRVVSGTSSCDRATIERQHLVGPSAREAIFGIFGKRVFEQGGIDPPVSGRTAPRRTLVGRTLDDAGLLQAGQDPLGMKARGEGIERGEAGFIDGKHEGVARQPVGESPQGGERRLVVGRRAARDWHMGPRVRPGEEEAGGELGTGLQKPGQPSRADRRSPAAAPAARSSAARGAPGRLCLQCLRRLPALTAPHSRWARRPSGRWPLPRCPRRTAARPGERRAPGAHVFQQGRFDLAP